MLVRLGVLLHLARVAAAAAEGNQVLPHFSTVMLAAHRAILQAARRELLAERSTAPQAPPALAHAPALAAAVGLLTARLQRLVMAATVEHPAAQEEAAALV
jgi:hypothetical protein